MKRSVAALLAFVAACAPLPPAEADNVVTGPGGKCDAAPAQSLLGRQASATVGADAMRLAGAGKLRWIAEGAAVTMDYSESRLNLQLDRQSRIVKIHCG